MHIVSVDCVGLHTKCVLQLLFVHLKQNRSDKVTSSRLAGRVF